MFSKLKVLELASVLAGPSVGQFFAELGAGVIKVENPATGGDVTRSWKTTGEESDDRSAYFCSCNWGKKSVLLNLASATDRELVLRLAATSDVVIASYKPGDAEKLGVGYDQIRIHKPDIIYGQISGYGPTDDRVGYDAVIQAESGFMDLNGEASGPPTKMPVALIDILAAHQLKEGLLLALLKKERTGEGSFVEVSLMETALASLANQATNFLLVKKLPTRQGSAHPNIAPYGDNFTTKDGKQLLLAVGSDRQFEHLLSVLGLDKSTATAYQTNQQRVQDREGLRMILAPAIGKLESATLLKALSKFKIPGGLIQNVRDALESPLAKGVMLNNGDVSGIRGFVGSATAQRTELSPPPHLGEHSEEVLRSIRS